MWSRLHDGLEEILPPENPPQTMRWPLLLSAHGSFLKGIPEYSRYPLWLFDPKEELLRFLLCITGFDFPQTTCGSLSLPSINSITYAVLIRVCKSNIKIIPWGNPMVQLCHFIFPFATLTRQGKLKHWARNYLFKASIQHTQTLDKDCSLSLTIKVAS